MNYRIVSSFCLALALGLVLGLTSCATLDPFLQIQPGMSKQDVSKLLGLPIDRRFARNKEDWVYQRRVGENSALKSKIVQFENERVSSLLDDEIELQRNHELQQVRSGAIQIRASARAGSLPCAFQNQYGAYSYGGGCNAFGCWPAGGSCNERGCTSQGQCNDRNCENRIESYRCEGSLLRP